MVDEAGGLEAVEPVVKGFKTGVWLRMVGLESVPYRREFFVAKKFRQRCAVLISFV